MAYCKTDCHFDLYICKWHRNEIPSKPETFYEYAIPLLSILTLIALIGGCIYASYNPYPLEGKILLGIGFPAYFPIFLNGICYREPDNIENYQKGQKV